MRQQFLLILMFFLSVIGVTESVAQTYDNEAVTANWAFEGTESNCIATSDGVLSMASFSKGSTTSLYTANTITYNNITYTCFQPGTNKASSANDGDAITFTIKPTAGLTLTSGKFSANIIKNKK